MKLENIEHEGKLYNAVELNEKSAMQLSRGDFLYAKQTCKRADHYRAGDVLMVIHPAKETDAHCYALNMRSNCMVPLECRMECRKSKYSDEQSFLYMDCAEDLYLLKQTAVAPFTPDQVRFEGSMYNLRALTEESAAHLKRGDLLYTTTESKRNMFKPNEVLLVIRQADKEEHTYVTVVNLRTQLITTLYHKQSKYAPGFPRVDFVPNLHLMVPSVPKSSAQKEENGQEFVPRFPLASYMGFGGSIHEVYPVGTHEVEVDLQCGEYRATIRYAIKGDAQGSGAMTGLLDCLCSSDRDVSCLKFSVDTETSGCVDLTPPEWREQAGLLRGVTLKNTAGEELYIEHELSDLIVGMRIVGWQSAEGEAQ